MPLLAAPTASLPPSAPLYASSLEQATTLEAVFFASAL